MRQDGATWTRWCDKMVRHGQDGATWTGWCDKMVRQEIWVRQDGATRNLGATRWCDKKFGCDKMVRQEILVRQDGATRNLGATRWCDKDKMVRQEIWVRQDSATRWCDMDKIVRLKILFNYAFFLNAFLRQTLLLGNYSTNTLLFCVSRDYLFLLFALAFQLLKLQMI